MKSWVASAMGHLRLPHGWTRRHLVLAVVLVLYALVTLGVIFRSPLLTWDTDLFKLDLKHQYPTWHPAIYYYVILGQRGPATLVFLPYFCWIAWRTRTTRPLVMLGTSLILLNLSVGVVKLLTGRVGPRQTDHVHDIFAGGDIFPSGHVSNAVVLYGLMAWIAIRYQKSAVAAAVFLSITVGMGTVYLDTHWFSDVLGGWIAGAVVLLVLPSVMPYAQRLADAGFAALGRRFRRPRRPAPAALGAAAIAPLGARVPATSTSTVRIGPSRVGGLHAQSPRTGLPRAQSAKATSVRSVARSHSRAATPASLDARDDPTRCG